ncbi:MAG: BatA domain-containing protein [Planctomycetota bacterium]|nr:BatA domain-containing protein [Planctomycetota bacterium]
MDIGLVTHWPGAFWLAIPVVAALVLFRLYRTRRREIVTGSLLLWRRIAAQQPKSRPKRVLVDLSLLLQIAALVALIAALTGPALALNRARGRGLFLVLDNGPTARARSADGQPLWKHIQAKAEDILRRLQPDDTVFVARTSPTPQILTPGGARPSAALDRLSALQPALSGPSAEQTWLFAADSARNLGKNSALALAVISLREAPAPSAGGDQWLCVAPSKEAIENVGIVDFGALPAAHGGKAEVQVLVRLRNFSSRPVEGTVRLEALGSGGAAPLEQPCRLGAHADEAVVFSVPRDPPRPLRIAWVRADGKSDALPEDDAIVAAPRPLAAPRVRFHAPVPALEKLYSVALNATFVGVEDSGPTDLEVYAGSVPERLPENARGILLLAPESGYGMFFDVGGKTLEWPNVQRDEDDPLTKGIVDKTGSIFPVPKACEILATGDYKPLLKDAVTQRVIVARLPEGKQRFGLVLAFVPGAGFPPERMLEPELAAILVRAALEAARTGEPYQVQRAAVLEMQSGEPLPLDWRPGADSAASGAGVLDGNASAVGLPVGQQSGRQDVEWAALQPLERGRTLDLGPWLIVTALLLAGAELWLVERRKASQRHNM